MSEAKNNINALLGQSRQPVNKKTYSPRYENKKSTVIGIRLLKDDKEKLARHFKLKGIINLSQGIREIVYKYMDSKNIL